MAFSSACTDMQEWGPGSAVPTGLWSRESRGRACLVWDICCLLWVPEPLFCALFRAWPELCRFLGPPLSQGCPVCRGAPQTGTLACAVCPGAAGEVFEGTGAPCGCWLCSLPAGRGTRLGRDPSVGLGGSQATAGDQAWAG